MFNTALQIAPSTGIFHNVYDDITDELKHQVLIAIIKELASILKVDIAVISANQMSPTAEMVCVATVTLLLL